MNQRRSERKGQVGIGTLIVFISMVLVAAIAAGVLVNTAGFLQTKSEETGQASSDQVTNRIDIAPKSGVVGTVDGEEVIGRVNVTVQSNPGAENVDLRNVTVQWIDPSGVYQLTYYTIDAGDGDFAATPLKDADDSLPVLNDADDRFILTFDTGGDPPDGGGPASGEAGVKRPDEAVEDAREGVDETLLDRARADLLGQEVQR